MDYHIVNFQVIEEAFLAAESKEVLYSIFMASATGKLDSDLGQLKGDNLPETLKQVPVTLGISSEKTQTLIISLHNLLKQYVATSMLDETILAEKFPADFKKQLKSFLFKAMREVAPLTKTFVQDQFTSTNRLEDFDWRLDFKVSSKNQERLKQPVLYVKMELEGGNDKPHQDVMFQVSKGQLANIIENFEVINQQLSGFASQMGGQEEQ